LPALMFRFFGATTLAARLPFALAGLAAVPLLFRLARQSCGSLTIASLSALLLALNPYWILHARQCRYYPLSSLFLVLTLTAWSRWQSGSRRGAAAFLVSAWCWFQVDYGTVLPVLAVLFVGAFLYRGLRQTAVVAAILTAT